MSQPAEVLEIFPATEPVATRYFSDGTFKDIENPEISVMDDIAMQFCLEIGAQALAGGNPPIGAVLVDSEYNFWSGATIDKTKPGLLRHAEIRAYEAARDTLGESLSGCTLVTTAQPCTTCIAPYAEGKIGRVIYAAPRSAVFEVTGLMRPRKINMHEMLADGATNTVVIEGYRTHDALGAFALWAKRRHEADNLPCLAIKSTTIQS